MDAGALEGVEIIDGGTVIADSAGDNHGTGARWFLSPEGRNRPWSRSGALSSETTSSGIATVAPNFWTWL
jgi:hypothetical protein